MEMLTPQKPSNKHWPTCHVKSATPLQEQQRLWWGEGGGGSVAMQCNNHRVHMHTATTVIANSRSKHMNAWQLGSCGSPKRLQHITHTGFKFWKLLTTNMFSYDSIRPSRLRCARPIKLSAMNLVQRAVTGGGTPTMQCSNFDFDNDNDHGSVTQAALLAKARGLLLSKPHRGNEEARTDWFGC